MISLVKRQAFHGPNPYAADAVVIADLRIGPDIARETPRIIATLAEMSARWLDADEAKDAPDDATEDAPEDERLCAFLMRWAHATLTCTKGYLPVHGYGRLGPDSVRLWIGFHQPTISFAALELATRLARDIAEHRLTDADFATELRQLWLACRLHHPDSSDEIVMRAATAAGIPWLPAWGLSYHWQFGWGAKSRVISSAASGADGYIGGRIAARKDLSKLLIARLGLPTPKHALLKSEADIPAAVKHVGFPCVVKPIDSGSGKGVSAGLAAVDEVAAAFHFSREVSSQPIMMEAFAEGTDHRIMVVEGRYAGTFRREAPTVVGDGRKTLRDLIDDENRTRSMPGVFAAKLLSPIAVDASSTRYLAANGFALDSVPAAGQRVRVRSNDNLSTGGVSTDVSAQTHPDIKAMAEMVARTLDANLAGLDYVTTDISRHWSEVPGALIELNLTPGLAVLTLAGRDPVEVGRMALGSDAGRIPLDIAIVPDAALGAIEAQLAGIGCTPGSGWASPTHAQLGNLSLQVKRDHPWPGTMTLLSHKCAERVLLVAPSRHVQQYGLPVDRADRIWLCSDDLPQRWLSVLEKASAAPLARAAWHDVLRSNGLRHIIASRQTDAALPG